MELVEKCYYAEYSSDIIERLNIINTPHWCMSLCWEPIEMNNIKITIVCLENQLYAIENALAPFM